MKKRDFLKIVVDLDGTILEEKSREGSSTALPLPGAIDAVNKLYEMGHVITIYTARPVSDQEVTLRQLEKYDMKYHYLILGKPVGDIFIDDRSFNVKDWRKDWRRLLRLINEKMKQPYEEKGSC
jgi:hypothetical protein